MAGIRADQDLHPLDPLGITAPVSSLSFKPEFLDLWYPARHVDEALRYIEEYEPHRYGPKWYK